MTCFAIARIANIRNHIVSGADNFDDARTAAIDHISANGYTISKEIAYANGNMIIATRAGHPDMSISINIVN